MNDVNHALTNMCYELFIDLIIVRCYVLISIGDPLLLVDWIERRKLFVFVYVEFKMTMNI